MKEIDQRLIMNELTPFLACHPLFRSIVEWILYRQLFSH